MFIVNGVSGSSLHCINFGAATEPVAWAGPIVMNTQEEIREAYIDLHNATFIKDNIRY